jgi:adenosylcobinamide-phosphate synthase
MTQGQWLTWPEQLSAYPLLLLVVVLATRLLPLPGNYHPLTVFRFFAQQLAIKVNPDPERPRQQLYISGSLALLVAWLPPMALLYSLYQFSELPLILDALLLYCSLDWLSQQQQARTVQHSLLRGQLTLAREQAKRLLCRRTAMLSEMGLSKAILESLILRSASQFIAVLCAFLLGGGLAALGYRLLLELHQQWNSKRSEFRHFARPVAELVDLLNAIPKLLSGSMLALQYGVLRCYHQCRQPRQNINRFSYFVLCCASVALCKNLGGPLYYNHHKQQRSKMLQQHEPAAADISTTIKMLQFSHIFFLLLTAGFSLLQLAWQLAR